MRGVDFTNALGLKSPPANARDTGVIPGPGKSHTPRGTKARMPQLLKPIALEPVHHAREATAMRSPRSAPRP